MWQGISHAVHWFLWKRIERNRHINYAGSFLEVSQTSYLNTSSFLISLLSYSVTLNWLTREPKNGNRNDVMEEQPVLIRDKKRCEQHDKVAVRIASFVGSKVIQRLVRHGEVLYLKTPWIASMIDEWVGHWQGKTEVLGEKMLSCQPVHQMSPHGLSWNRTHNYAVKCWRKTARAIAIYECVRVCKPLLWCTLRRCQ